MPPKAVQERRKRELAERQAREAKLNEAKLKEEEARKRRERIKKAKDARKKLRQQAEDVVVEGDDDVAQVDNEGILAFAKQQKRIDALAGKDKPKVSIIVEKTEPPPVSELTEEILDNYTREGMSIYTSKAPVFIDLSHKLWRLTKLENIDLINPTAVREIDLTENALNKIGNEPLHRFVNLRRLTVARNIVREFELVECPKLCLLDLNSNLLATVPKMLQLSDLQYLDLSHNKLEEGWDNLIVLRKLKYLYLQGNQFKWSQDDFNNNILKLMDLKFLIDLNLSENPFLSGPNAVRQYRPWVITNSPHLVRLDGEIVQKEEKKNRLKEEPLDIDLDDGKDSDTEVAYNGPICKHKLTGMIAVLRDCFDKPALAVRAIKEVEQRIESHLSTPTDGRLLFDVRDSGDRQARVTSLLSSFKENSKGDEEMRDPREPVEIIEDFVMTVDLLIARQPVMAKKAMGLLGQLLGLPQSNVNKMCEDKLMEYLAAGDQYADMVVEVLRKYIVPRMQAKKTDPVEREMLLSSMNRLASHPAVIEAMQTMTNEISTWLSEPDPSAALLGVVASATLDAKISHDLREQQITGRIIQLKGEIDISGDTERRKCIMRIVGHLSQHDRRFAEDFRIAKIHNDGLQELNNLLASVDTWTQDQMSRAEALITAIHGMCVNDAVVLEEAQSNGYVDRLIKVLEKPNLHPRLMSNVLRALTGIVEVIESVIQITSKLRGIVWLLAFLDGKGYAQMCRLTNAMIESLPAPIEQLEEQDVLSALIAIVNLLTVYHRRARKGDIEAGHTVAKLDSAGREDFLFKLLESSDDTLRLAVVECLNWVPLSNFQEHEISSLVGILSGVDNLSVGRTEEVVGGVLRLLTQLVADTSDAGFEFRSSHVDVVHMVLDILQRNTKRDTRNSRQESEEKAALSDSCIDFLMAATLQRWRTALDVMMTRTAVLAMGQILADEEKFGRPDRPVMIEKTGVGRSIKALLYALPNTKMDGHVAKRVLLRMAEVLEGLEISSNVSDTMIPTAIDHSKESEETKQWRLAQHAIFVQIEGIESMLKYLLENAAIDKDQFAPRGVAERFAKHLRDEESNSLAMMMGEKLGAPPDPDVPSDGMQFLLNEELHNPRLVSFPVQTIATLFGERMQTDKSSSQSFANAPAVAAALRVFSALLMHGSAASQAKAIKKARDMEFVQSLVSLSARITHDKWHPSGVGDNLLTIFDFLFQMHKNRAKEGVDVIPLYDVASQVFRSMLSVVEPHVDAVLDDYTAHNFNTEKRLLKEEESLFQRLAFTMRTMMFSLQYIMPSDNLDINETIQDALAMQIIDLKMLRGVLKYIYYDFVIGRLVWGQADVDSVDHRTITRKLINDFICEYLHVNEGFRFDILEFFNRMEVQRNMSLGPAFMTHMLETVKHRSYLHALEKYLVTKNFVPGEFERLVFCDWLDIDTHKDTDWNQRLQFMGLKHTLDEEEDNRREQERKRQMELDRDPKNANKKATADTKSEATVAKQERDKLVMHPPVTLPAIPFEEKDDDLIQPTSVVVATVEGAIQRIKTTMSLSPQEITLRARPKVLGVPRQNSRLVAISNLAYYIFDKPPGKPCNVCDASKFCPEGPVLKSRREFRTTIQVLLHPSRQRLRLWYASSNKKGEKTARLVTYSCMRLNVLDNVAQLLCDYFPLQHATEKPFVMADDYTLAILKRNLQTEKDRLLGVAKRTTPAGLLIKEHEDTQTEKIFESIMCWEGPEELEEKRLLVVISNRCVYVYRENLDWWLVETMEDKYLHLITQFELSALHTIQFFSTSTPRMQLGFDQASLQLTFACNVARELFRVTLKRAIDVSSYLRKFVSSTDASAPSGATSDAKHGKD